MTDITPISAPARPPNIVVAVWAGEHRFDTHRPGGVSMRLDGKAETGQTPPDALLSAVAACSGIDVVDILAKRRTPVDKLTIEVKGDRRSEHPRRFVKLLVTYDLQGAGIDRGHAERAVSLAMEKYCSVAASLAGDLVIATIVVLNGDAGDEIRQQMSG
jgi:putative redox protein